MKFVSAPRQFLMHDPLTKESLQLPDIYIYIYIYAGWLVIICIYNVCRFKIF